MIAILPPQLVKIRLIAISTAYTTAIHFIFTGIGAFILYGIYAAAGTGSLETISLISSLTFTTNYINLTIFLAFAVLYPEMQILLFFIISVKILGDSFVFHFVFLLGSFLH